MVGQPFDKISMPVNFKFNWPPQQTSGMRMDSMSRNNASSDGRKWRCDKMKEVYWILRLCRTDRKLFSCDYVLIYKGLSSESWNGALKLALAVLEALVLCPRTISRMVTGFSRESNAAGQSRSSGAFNNLPLEVTHSLLITWVREGRPWVSVGEN